MADAPRAQAHVKLMRFRVLRHAWECDPFGWVVEYADGRRAILLTDHGREFEATEDDLHDLLTAYDQASKEIQTAMDLAWRPDTSD